MRSATATVTVTFIALVAAACSAPAAQTWSFAPPAGGVPAASPSDTLFDAGALAPVDGSRSTSGATSGPVGTGAAGTTGDGDTAGGLPPARSQPSVGATAPAAAEVEIVDFAFGPANVTVASGGRVTWTNRDGERHSILVDGAESPRLESGDTFGRTFASSGTFEYVCGLHPSMTGTIVVAGESAAPAGAGSTGGADDGGPDQPSPTGSPEATDDHDDDRDDDDRSGHGGDDDDDDGDDDDDDHSGHGRGGDDDRDDDDRSGHGGRSDDD